MNLLQASLLGGAAFRRVDDLLAGLDIQQAQASVPGAPYTLAALLVHLNATMRVSLDLAYGKMDAWPEGLNVWPEALGTEAEFAQTVTELRLMLAEANLLAHDPSSQTREILLDLAVHNAYHWGQVALLRQQQGQVFSTPDEA